MCRDRLDCFGDELEKAYNDGNLTEYILDNYDEEYRIDSRKCYRSCKIALAIGGPGVWLDTSKSCLRLVWGFTDEYLAVRSEIIEEVDDIMRESCISRGICND